MLWLNYPNYSGNVGMALETTSVGAPAARWMELRSYAFAGARRVSVFSMACAGLMRDSSRQTYGLVRVSNFRSGTLFGVMELGSLNGFCGCYH
jgi:hypothetical protein